MAYADAQSPQQKAAGLAGAAIAHAGIGALVIAGLSVTQAIGPIIDTGPMPTREWKEIPPPPPPEPRQEATPDSPKFEKPVFVPKTPLDLPTEPVFTETTFEFPPIGPIEQVIDPVPSPTPGTGMAQPVSAVPRNNTASWIRDSDYKSRWVREERFGRASFVLDINAKGRVENCSITRSTGHSVLDKATCDLITKRARFKPAETSNGTPTSGTFSSSIHWQLPE